MKLRIAASSRPDFRPFGDHMISRGYDITYFQTVNNTEDELIANLQGFDAIVAFGEPFTEKVFQALEGQLKIVCRFGLGYDMVDLNAAARHGVCATNTAGTMAGGVAETAILHMLECARRFSKYDAEMHGGLWTHQFIGTQLADKVVGIIGFGSIGQRLAQCLQGFNCRLLAYDVYYNEAALARYGVEKATLADIAAQSDFVSVHCQLSEATKGIVSKDFLARMKPTAYIVNTSRGPTIDEPAMIDALKNGKIAGAGLDVFSREPLEAGSELRGLPNVIMTPHIASFTKESFMECTEDIMVSLDLFESGKVPVHCLNPGYVENIK